MLQELLQVVHIVVFHHAEKLLFGQGRNLVALGRKGRLHAVPDRCEVFNSHLDESCIRTEVVCFLERGHGEERVEVRSQTGYIGQS